MGDTEDLFGTVSTTDRTEEDIITAAEVVQQLEQAWINEMQSPELLPPQIELVDCVLDQAEQMNNNLASLSKVDFRLAIHKMEVERLNYMVTSYLRVRLEKIEKFAVHLLDEQERLNKNVLTPHELQFAKEYVAGVTDHLKTLALNLMPPNLRELDPRQTAVKPNKESIVFIKALRDCPPVLVEEPDGDEEVEIIANSQYILPYKSIASLVESGHVRLT